MALGKSHHADDRPAEQHEPDPTQEAGRPFDLAPLEEELKGLLRTDDHHHTRQEENLRAADRRREGRSASRRLGLSGRTLPIARRPLSKNIITPADERAGRPE